jgi:hypothetical protein
LSGPIPPELGNLANLQQLGLGSNQFNEPIPPELGNLTNLQFLYLNNGRLSGSIPLELGNLTNLQVLFLSNNNQLTGAIPLGFTSLTALERFVFGFTDLCEPSDPAFQRWMDAIEVVQSTNVLCDDGTAPECGPITVAKNDDGQLTTVRSFARDPESGIQRADFIRLDNLRGFLNDAGPYSEDEVQTFDPATTPRVDIRGERIRFDAGGAIIVRVTNGEGLSADCDPVVETLVAEAPEAFALEASYPNPFHGTTTIPFSVAEPAYVRLAVYDLLGREVARLVDREMAPGTYEVQWSAPKLASGTYFYRIEAGSFQATRRLSLVK